MLTAIQLVQRVIGANVRSAAYFDKSLETDGDITINDDAYSDALDRVYNVKSMRNMHVETENTGGANGLTYTIESASKDYASLSDLEDADFVNVLIADTNIAAGAKLSDDIEDITPQTTAIRVRVRRQSAGLDTTRQGIVSSN